MEYSVDTLVREARVAIDRNANSAPLASLGDIDTLTLDEIIRSKVEDAARLVEESAAHWLLDGDSFVVTGEDPVAPAITWESGRTEYVGGSFPLSGYHFLRLVSFKMSDWSRPVTVAITEDSPLYDLQSSKYGGVRGNPQKPVVAITHKDGGLELEFYSCKDTSATIEKGEYVKMPEVHTVSSEDYINLCTKLRSAVVYRIAAMTAESIGDGNLSQVLLARSNELAGIE